jgi:hypothetical protein
LKIKRDKKDKVFSDLVRGRADFRCELCETYYPEDDRRGLECAHIVGRAKARGLRWHPINAISLCTGHHMNFTGNPLEFSDWVEARYGRETTDKLRIMAQETYKFSKPELEDIYQNLKASWQQMEVQRQDGAQGRIEFESPYA